MPRRECYSATHLPASPPPFPHAEKWETGVISLSCLVGPGWGGRVLPTPQVGGGPQNSGGFFRGRGRPGEAGQKLERSPQARSRQCRHRTAGWTTSSQTSSGSRGCPVGAHPACALGVCGAPSRWPRASECVTGKVVDVCVCG